VRGVDNNQEPLEQPYLRRIIPRGLEDDRPRPSPEQRTLRVDDIAHVDGELEPGDERVYQPAKGVEERHEREEHGPVADERADTPQGGSRHENAGQNHRLPQEAVLAERS